MRLKKRNRPYVWVTWIAGILAGTDTCVWRAWLKANFEYEKRKDENSAALEDWVKRHDAMTEARAEKLKKEGFVVRVEDDNSFKLEGVKVTLSGKPDIVALKDNIAKVIDEKSGKRKLKDQWQVQIYMFAMPLTWLRGYEMEGEVEYRDGCLPVSLRKDAPERISNLMKILGDTASPEKTPTRNNCRYCDVDECPVRFNDQGVASVNTF